MAVLCTHAHDDHVRVAPALGRAVGAPVLLHPDDLPLWRLTHGDVPPDGDLADGQEIAVAGTTLQVLHTPGHAPGAVCFYAPDLGIVFTGDTLFQGGPGATGRSFSDRDLLLHSITDQLLGLPAAHHRQDRARRRHDAGRRAGRRPARLSRPSTGLSAAGSRVADVPHYLRSPHLHGDLVTFVAADDVWLAPVGGGRAWRLTDDRAPVRSPRFSPDGTHVAWASTRDGHSEVYVVPVEGGDARRLTWWGSATTAVLGWTADGRVLVASAAREANLRRQVVHAVGLDLAVERLPYGPAWGVAVRDDGVTALATVGSRPPAGLEALPRRHRPAALAGPAGEARTWSGCCRRRRPRWSTRSGWAGSCCSSATGWPPSPTTPTRSRTSGRWTSRTPPPAPSSSPGTPRRRATSATPPPTASASSTTRTAPCTCWRAPGRSPERSTSRCRAGWPRAGRGGLEPDRAAGRAPARPRR